MPTRRTSNTAVAKATVHELTHHVEYRTTARQRARLYAGLGIRNPSGNYFAFNDGYYYSGSLARWKASPRERLAESVVDCTYGSPNHKGMKLVPRGKCKPLPVTLPPGSGTGPLTRGHRLRQAVGSSRGRSQGRPSSRKQKTARAP